MKHHIPAAKRLLLFFLLLSLSLSGCSLTSHESEYTSRGVDDGIDGFLYNFDQREEVKALVEYKGKNQYPIRVSWTYGLEAVPEAESEQITENTESLQEAETAENDQSPEEIETAEDIESLEDTTDIKESTPAGVLSSDDPDLIREIYFALSNTIILGVDNNQKEEPHFYIAFTLPDDTECRFSFISETSIRISNQNYIVESDGTLWRSLSPDS